MTPDRWPYQALTIPPPGATPPVDAWSPAPAIPARRPAWGPPVPEPLPWEPADWPAAEEITLDKWFAPLAEPVRFHPPRPPGDYALQIPPELIPFEPAKPWILGNRSRIYGGGVS